ncbi:hypothetical protein G6011_06882 [Alternaria panax]|uniref:Uncharacterized protein n=1 Tax=Alternaria panax TaxID=48097 RepID=A0AAD4FA04_9PLEO|nr:hypothetical protein G6011_06882 [Alternaria panax]
MSLSALDNRVLNPLDGFLREPDVSTRFVLFDEEYLQRLARTDTESLRRHAASTAKSGGSLSSSMAPVALHQTTASAHNAPSLRSCQTDATPTESSISTTLASRFSGFPLLEDNNGVLERPHAQCRTPFYECVFWFLNCPYASQDREEWETHCSSHFRGEEPPNTVQCPLCEWGVTCEVGGQAWSMRMQHLAYEHTMRGQTLRTSRPDFWLFEYLWRVRLIDAADLKELRGGNHNLTHTLGNFVEMSRRRRERSGRTQAMQHAREPRRS